MCGLLKTSQRVAKTYITYSPIKSFCASIARLGDPSLTCRLLYSGSKMRYDSSISPLFRYSEGGRRAKVFRNHLLDVKIIILIIRIVYKTLKMFVFLCIPQITQQILNGRILEENETQRAQKHQKQSSWPPCFHTFLVFVFKPWSHYCSHYCREISSALATCWVKIMEVSTLFYRLIPRRGSKYQTFERQCYWKTSSDYF